MIEIVNIPDINFRNYILKQLNKPRNYEITKDDCESITEIICQKCNITSLKGVEYFTNLTYLWCPLNKITSLDLSKNVNLKKLYCSGNQLESLELSKNIFLTYLSCYKNKLTRLDLSMNVDLGFLYCNENPLINIILNKKINHTANHHYKSIIKKFNTLTLKI